VLISLYILDKKCSVCKKTVYVNEMVEGMDAPIHQTCFYCSYQGCKVKLALTSYGAYDGTFYCPNHFKSVAVHTNPLDKKEVVNVTRKDSWKSDIEKLKEFKNRGILSNEEFESKSKLILDKGL